MLELTMTAFHPRLIPTIFLKKPDSILHFHLGIIRRFLPKRKIHKAIQDGKPNDNEGDAIEASRLNKFLDADCFAPNSFHNLAYSINHRLRSVMLYVMPALFNHDQFAHS